jgi:selenium metabolism protein YedF
MEQSERVVTLVDNETSKTNVSRMAARAGWVVNAVQEGAEYRIELTRGESNLQPDVQQVGKAEVVSGPLVLLISSETMGRGDPKLGDILMRGFFHTLGEVEPLPQTIIFLNSGVRLACEGSAVLDDLCTLEAEDVEILVCGTCLGYFELTDKLVAGQVSNMYDIAETMLSAGKLVSL